VRKFNVLAGILCAFLLSSMLSATFIVTAQTVVDSNGSDSPRGTSQPALSPTKLWSFTVVNSSWEDPPVIANGIAYVFNTKYYTDPSERYFMFGPPSHPLVTVYALNDSDGSKLWEYQAKGELQFFTVVNGKAYFSTTEYSSHNYQYFGAYVYALDAFSGAEKWVYYVDGMIFGSKFDSGNGAFYVFFVASGSLDSFVSAVNSINGKEIWRYKFGSARPTPVAIGEGAMYFGVNNCFYALSTSDGEIVWSATLESSIEDVPPVLGDDVVYFNSEKMTYAFSLNGSQLWNYSGFSYPISSNGVGYVRDGDAVYAYDGMSGNKIWSYSANETIWPLELSDDVLFVGLNGTLTALNAADGAQLWNYSLPGILRFTFGRYYGVDEHAANLLISKGTLLCYSGKTLRAIDISNGKTLWDYTDYDRAFLTVVGGLAFFKTSHTIYAYSIPDIVPSPLQSPTAQPEESFKYPGLAIEAWIIVSIVGVTTASLIVFLAKKRIQEKKRALNIMEVAS
jgi:outer membrane protein assembly factor BamB